MDQHALNPPPSTHAWLARRIHWHGFRFRDLPEVLSLPPLGDPDAVLSTPTEVADWMSDQIGIFAVRPGVRFITTAGHEHLFDGRLDLTLHANNAIIASRGDSVHHSYLTDVGGHVHLFAQAVTEQRCGRHPVPVDLTTVD